MARRLKFYGWGYEGDGLSEPERDHLFGFVAQRLGAEPRPAAPPSESEIVLAAPRVVAPAALASVLTADPYERLLHTYGKSFPETVRAFARDFANAPDLVAVPADGTQVAAVLDWASGAKVAIIPFGGGSSVVGGVEPAFGDAFAGAVSLDLRRLNQVLEVDAASRRRGFRRKSGARRSSRRSSRMASPSVTIRRVSSTRRSAAGSRPAPAGTSQPSPRTSTTSSKACAR